MIELRIALKSLPAADGKPLPLDFTTTPVPPAVAQQIQNQRPAARAPSSSGGGRHRGGRHRGGGMNGGGQGGMAQSGQSNAAPAAAQDAPTVPDPLDLELSVKLSAPAR
ncbi:MAG TPA: hypothetical protein VH309_08210, partial [Elusimicrobiota bacterium]|nr:hypothetical protein [Elusimicrobiota bacterium]